MLRRIIERSAFVALLGMAATYALAATLGVILMADGLARVSVVWPRLMPLAAVMAADCCGAAG
jgi:hypothetical protein